MAQQFYKIDLQDSEFPMLSEQQTRTAMATSSREAAADPDNIPGIAYCHNVMPSKYGMDSIGFSSVVPAVPNPLDDFLDVRIVYSDTRSRLYIAWDATGNPYALTSGSSVWVSIPATVPATISFDFSSDSVTIGTVNGVSYIFYAGIGAFNYNETTNTLDAVTLAGINIPSTLGVVASSGYLIAYTDAAIAWSSTIDPTDFVPSAVTGAGGGNVAGIAGAILFLTSNTLGIIIHAAANSLAGTYTGNIQFPFKFREIEGSKGGISLDLVAYEANSAAQFVFSKAGMQSVTSQRAENILPEVTDFLAGKRFEDYNTTTLLYEVTDIIGPMLKKIKYVASRYLVISYGISSFTHALVFDTALEKLGKIRLTHVDCFEYVDSQVELAKETLAFVLASGEVQIVDFATSASSDGVLILGKLQATRTRQLTLLGVEVENVESGSILTVSDQVSLDGKTFITEGSTVRHAAENIREYYFRVTGKNHSIVFLGKFNLVTAQIRYTIAGRR